MYIKRLEIKNIRCFENIIIDFNNLGSSLLILGDNSNGKSTILKCLAIGLCDESSASALLRELPGEFIRRKPGEKFVKKRTEGSITVTLQDIDRSIYRLHTRIISGTLFERIYQDKLQKLDNENGSIVETYDQDDFPWSKIFASGYGAGSRTQGTADFRHYLTVDAIYSIFKPDIPLQNPELVIRRLVEAARNYGIEEQHKDVILNNKINFKEIKDRFVASEYRANEMLDGIKTILSGLLKLENEDCFVLSKSGIEVSGSWGNAEIGELGDGYNATITWVLDLLSWWFIRKSSRGGYRINDIRGIVLVDEIEQHLHPSWQREILSLLHIAFPKIQFIISSHSPLCAAGTADIKSGKYQIIGMDRKNEKVEPKHIPIPIGFRADQILTSEAFGLDDTRNKNSENLIIKYRELSTKVDPSKEEVKELKELRILVQDLPEVGQFENERNVRRELSDLLEKLKLEMSKGKKR